jgi:hypothetical protein
MSNQTFSCTWKYFSALIVTPLMAGLLTLCGIQMVPLFRYDDIKFLPLFAAWCISSPIIAVLISLYTGRVSSTLTFTTEGMHELRRYLFGLIPVRHSFVWSDFSNWYQSVVEDDENKTEIIGAFLLFTKSKRSFRIIQADTRGFKVDGTSFNWKDMDKANAAWKTATEAVAANLNSVLPEGIPQWYQKREDAQVPWILGFFITAIIVMVLAYLSPIFVAIFAMLRSIIR